MLLTRHACVYLGKTIGCILFGELSTATRGNRCVSALFSIRETRAAVLGWCAEEIPSAASAFGNLEMLVLRTGFYQDHL